MKGKRIIAIPLMDHVTEQEALEIVHEIQRVFQFHHEPLVWTVDKSDHNLMTAASDLGIDSLG